VSLLVPLLKQGSTARVKIQHPPAPGTSHKPRPAEDEADDPQPGSGLGLND
jgi:hypothetical protein